jgi:hypothetical protein
LNSQENFMSKRRALLVVALVATLTVAAWAAKAAPTITTFLFPGTFNGVHGDGQGDYVNGVGGVKSYFGVNGKDADLVTYNTSRTLRLQFDPSSQAYINSGLRNVSPTGEIIAQVDLFALNYYGPYRTQGNGTTAQVQMDLEFKVGNLTYELDYSSLGSYRKNANTWVITNDSGQWGGGNPGFVPAATARLNVIRRKSVESFGTVEMPITFEMRLP